MSDVLILYASSREFGNTRLVADLLCKKTEADLLFINELDLSYCDYEHSNQTDRFIPTFEQIKKIKSIWDIRVENVIIGAGASAMKLREKMPVKC